jgi:uncharacterized protein with FMN-binding domain
VRARALALSIVSSAAVLTVGWQLGTQGQTATAPEASAPTTAGTATTDPTTTAGSATTTPSGASTPTPAPTPTATDGSASAAAPASDGVSGTFTGTSVQTRFGPVQVQVTVASGSITDVSALQLTDKDQRSVSISNRAAPVLRQEVLAAQSANVQGVSGATYTSDAYLSSLQSALDQAGL